MYATILNRTQRTADLAAGLTDAALAILADVDMPGDSVDTELKLWHTLHGELERERPCQRSAVENKPVDGILQKVIHRAARQVAEESDIYRALRSA